MLRSVGHLSFSIAGFVSRGCFAVCRLGVVYNHRIAAVLAISFFPPPSISLRLPALVPEDVWGFARFEDFDFVLHLSSPVRES